MKMCRGPQDLIRFANRKFGSGEKANVFRNVRRTESVDKVESILENRFEAKSFRADDVSTMLFET